MVNEQIRSREVRLVIQNEEGSSSSDVVSTESALEMAREQELDLICVDPKSDVPVVMIGDYSKYLYEKKKREKLGRKKARENEQKTKMVQIGADTAENDLKVKASNVKRMLSENDKVQISIRFRGRQMKFINNGPSILQDFVNMLDCEYMIEHTPKIAGNTVSMLIAPKKKKRA